jgi:molybdopterin-guanine dinucleotide biosynthesis protein A
MSLAVLVLAGGRSRRMGTDKALLKLDGEPLLARTVRLAQGLSPTVAIACPDPDRYRDCLPQDVRWLPEAQPEGPRGPLAALAMALPRLEGAWVLLLACDLPHLDREPLRQWAAQLPGLSSGVSAAVPRTERGWEPLCGFYRTTAQASLEDWLAQGRRDFQGWLDTQPVRALPVTDPELLFNCNTLAEWQAIAAPSEDRH